jgi:hypothetical protein
MWDFVSVMADYIWNEDGSYDKTILTTLADLEDSDIFEHQNAEGKTLARTVLNFVNGRGELSIEDAKRFKVIMQERVPENIENLLNRALDIPEDEFGASFVPQRFNFAINRIFARIGANLNKGYLESFLERQFQESDTKHTFISFNYDLVLEQCIQRQKGLGWDVKLGYGFEVERLITPEGAAEHMLQFGGTGGAFRLLKSHELKPCSADRQDVKVLKPHGSLNWLLGFKENYHFIDATPIFCLNYDGSIAYYPDFSCQHIQLKDEIGFDLSEESVWTGAALYLIPPADTKTRDLKLVKTIRSQEEEAYQTADEVYVIGWSLPPTDLEQVEIIERTIQLRTDSIKRLILINYKADSAYYDRIANLFRLDQRRLVICDDGFSEYKPGTNSSYECLLPL